MRVSLFLLLVLLTLSSSAQVTFGGFDTLVCGQQLTNAYTYENWTSGGGSGATHGFTVYRNGNAVYSLSGQQSNSKTCMDLVFIDDNTGFLVFYSGLAGNQLLKTSDAGQNWAPIGGGAPDYWGLYPVNAYAAYLVTHWAGMVYVDLCSDQRAPKSSSVQDSTAGWDIYRQDTLVGQPLCPRDSLRIWVGVGGDTVTIHLYFSYVPVGIGAAGLEQAASVLFPNPAITDFQLSGGMKEADALTIHSMEGRVVASYGRESISQAVIPVGHLSAGIYVVQVRKGRQVAQYKLVIDRTR